MVSIADIDVTVGQHIMQHCVVEEVYKITLHKGGNYVIFKINDEPFAVLDILGDFVALRKLGQKDILAFQAEGLKVETIIGRMYNVNSFDEIKQAYDDVSEDREITLFKSRLYEED